VALSFHEKDRQSAVCGLGNGIRLGGRVLERETGLEPATLCSGKLGLAIRIWRSLISAISPGNEPLSPEALTLKLQTIIRPGMMRWQIWCEDICLSDD